MSVNNKKTKTKIPLFVSIPHSGVKIPFEAHWLRAIDSSVLMCDVDAFVDDLYSPALEEFKVPSVFFEWHRYSVDVNRFSEDVSPWTVEVSERILKRKKIKDNYKQRKKNPPPTDVHWHKTTKGDLLISKALSKKIHDDLIKKYFNPFHQKLKKQIIKFKKAGNKNIYLLDLHSMPSRGLNFHRDTGETRKQVVISDNEGKSCSKAFRDLVLRAYKVAGFEVGLNWPYTGGAIIQHYGQPDCDQHCLQVELNRKLYINERTKNKTSNYKQIQIQLRQAMAYIIQHQNQLL